MTTAIIVLAGLLGIALGYLLGTRKPSAEMRELQKREADMRSALVAQIAQERAAHLARLDELGERHDKRVDSLLDVLAQFRGQAGLMPPQPIVEVMEPGGGEEDPWQPLGPELGPEYIINDSNVSQ